MREMMTTSARTSLRTPSKRGARDGTTDEGLQKARDEWMHEFRNALGNVTIAASAARCELTDRRPVEAAALMLQIEEGCERCLGLLKTMPR